MPLECVEPSASAPESEPRVTLWQAFSLLAIGFMLGFVWGRTEARKR